MPKMKEVIPTEAAEQIKLAVWLTKKGIRFTASANGGQRNLLEALKFKRMGVSPGFPDIEIPLPIAPYHGCYIELKRQKGGKLSENQVDWLKYLTEKGYYAVCCRGFDEAKEIVLHYLSLAESKGILC